MTHATVIGACGDIFAFWIHIDVVDGHRVRMTIPNAQIGLHGVALVIQQIDTSSECAKDKKL